MAVASTILQISLLLYLQATIAVNLYPWNDFEAMGDGARRFRLVPMFLGLGAAQAVSIAVTILEIEVLMVFGLALYGAWLGVQLWAWWRPYLRSAPLNGTASCTRSTLAARRASCPPSMTIRPRTPCT